MAIPNRCGTVPIKFRYQFGPNLACFGVDTFDSVRYRLFAFKYCTVPIEFRYQFGTHIWRFLGLVLSFRCSTV
ncbi:hypothetical protein HanXRQr2_Chr01g0027781 [Helianthus annuus]|uniref:Uncharacterized protein n=1 Tax=Helianthus annuus TaxID=4232 RepID=A0A9K3JWD4_HELAN|nr:hypothetical protein HanXRQr2_Chr01g0027781 [Helianthus annuus]